MSQAEAILRLVTEKVAQETTVLDALRDPHSLMLRVWYEGGAPVAVTLEYVESYRPKRWRKGEAA